MNAIVKPNILSLDNIRSIAIIDEILPRILEVFLPYRSAIAPVGVSITNDVI
jgi:hypothetical protein